MTLVFSINIQHHMCTIFGHWMLSREVTKSDG